MGLLADLLLPRCDHPDCFVYHRHDDDGIVGGFEVDILEDEFKFSCLFVRKKTKNQLSQCLL